MFSTLRCAALAATTLALAAGAAQAQNGNTIKVTVVAILGTDKSTHVCPELKDIAPELKKKNPKLTGFTLERSTSKSMKIGEKDLVTWSTRNCRSEAREGRRDQPVCHGRAEWGKWNTRPAVGSTSCFTGYRTKERTKFCCGHGRVHEEIAATRCLARCRSG